MKVKISENCKMAPEGHTTIAYKKDEIVTGKAAEIALKYKLGKKMKGKKTPEPEIIKPQDGPTEEG